MEDDGQLNLDGYASPKALTESMVKRYKQMHAAFPDSSHSEIFQFILDNRYKLLGTSLPASQREMIVRLAKDSLTILTFNTLVAENKEVIDILSRSADTFKSTVEIISDTISKESKHVESLSLDEIEKYCKDFMDSLT